MLTNFDTEILNISKFGKLVYHLFAKLKYTVDLLSLMQVVSGNLAIILVN